MIDQEMEFQISQYIDGQLPADDAARIATLAISDPEVAQAIARYRALDQQLKSALALPAYDADALVDSITATLDARQGRSRDVIFAMPAVWARRAGIAVAACLVAAVGTFLVISQSGDSTPIATGTAQVTGPQVEVASAPAITEISIAPAGQGTAQIYANQAAADVVVGRPSRAVIASSRVPADDSRGWPAN